MIADMTAIVHGAEEVALDGRGILGEGGFVGDCGDSKARKGDGYSIGFNRPMCV